MEEIELGSRAKLIIQIVEYKGKNYIDLRKWFMDVTGKWRPTKKGVMVEMKLKEKLQKAIENLE